jgi:hypothetical protein
VDDTPVQGHTNPLAHRFDHDRRDGPDAFRNGFESFAIFKSDNAMERAPHDLADFVHVDETRFQPEVPAVRTAKRNLSVIGDPRSPAFLARQHPQVRDDIFVRDLFADERDSIPEKHPVLRSIRSE